mmetsp:Transcript_60061/g.190800  ORF Transcript_60061/g.190800 Transcript_60061/m.190800 type:complete len:239 (-) Transcript_60061:689-1405(-)
MSRSPRAGSARASSSVIPTVATGGCENTAHATLSWSGLVGWSRKAVLAKAMPSMSATGVRLMRSVTSPMAHTPSAVVREYSSTLIAPLLVSSTPAASRPRLATLGLRPVAHMTSSASMGPLVVSSLRPPPSSLVMDSGLAPACTVMPLASYCSCTNARTSSSKPRRGRSCRKTRCTSEPMDLKIAANSSAMYPPPITTIFLGRAGSSRASSEVIPSSAPGTSGTKARPPTATRMCLAV